MIDNNKERWQLFCQIAKDEPGKEHTELLTTDTLKDNENFVVYKYENQANYETEGNIVASFRDEEGNLMIARTKKACHELVAAQSGAGKTQCVILNEALCMDGKTSYVFLDPKGEITERAYALAVEKYGKENVMIANFMQPEASTIHIGPISEIAQRVADAAKKSKEAFNKALKKAETELTKFLEACFPITSQKDPTWERIARVFLFSILFGLMEDIGLTDEEVKKYGRIRPLPSQINFATAERIFNSFGEGRSFDDRGFFSNRPFDSIAGQRSKIVSNNADSTRRNYLGFVQDDLAMYNDPRIILMASDNTLQIERVAQTPCVLFLIYDISDAKMREWVNCVFAYEMSKLLAYSHELAQPLPVPVRFMADEFPTLKAHDIYPNILATGRGTNIYISVVVQSLSQLEARYPTEWKTMVENCALKVFLSTTDYKTAEKFISDMGMTTIPNAGCFLIGQYQAETVSVVTFDKLMHRMTWGETYVTLDRSMPLHGNFEMYYKTPEYYRYPLVKNTEHKMDYSQKETEYDSPWLHYRFDLDDEDDCDDDDETENSEDNPGEDSDEGDIKIPDFEGMLNDILNEDDCRYDIWFIRAFGELLHPAYRVLLREMAGCIGKRIGLLRGKEPGILGSVSSKEKAERIVAEMYSASVFVSAIDVKDYMKEFDETDNEESFQNVCMDVIEDIVSRDKRQTRFDAIAVSKVFLEQARKNNLSDNTIAVWTRVIEEFETATDEEYEMLRKQIFE